MSELESSTVLSCQEHPDVETVLRCGKCDRPICPRCTVQTPVGARCRSCARLRRLPTYDVSARQYGQAIGAGLGLALIVGAGWAIGNAIAGGLLGWIMAAVAGYAIGEGIAAAVNHRRGPWLELIAAVNAYIAFSVSVALPGLLMAAVAGPIAIEGVLAALAAAAMLPLRSFMLVLPAAIAVLLAASRLR